MIYVFLSVCCSVVVSVMLKLARRYSIDVFQAVTWNYSTAILLTCIIYRPHLANLRTAPFDIYALLGVLLPVVFVLLGASVRRTGIVRTDIAQRLSLFIPIIASFLLFNEVLTPLKLTGIAVGFVAIVFSIPWQKKESSGLIDVRSWFYLMLVFAGFGVVDVLFKQVALFSAVSFTASLLVIYIIAFLLSVSVLLYLVATKKVKFSMKHILFGWMLGIANFGNILFYLKAHQKLSHNPSAVFSAMNIGVISLGALIGILVFKEKLSWLNRISIGLAIVAIIIITISQRP